MDSKSINEKTNAVDNLRLWKDLEATDPDYTKDFDKGTYKGTAINPVYIFKSITELFGPVGNGWKFEVLTNEPVFLQDGQVLSIVDVDFYYKLDGEWSAPIRGSGGDFIVRQTRNGLKVDDDGRKKAITDALTNATRLLGKSADIHMGLFDDANYKVDLAEKFQNKDLNWKEVSTDLYNELGVCTDQGCFIEFQERNEGLIETMPQVFEDTIRQYIEQKATELSNGNAKKWSHAFHGTKDAYDWFKKASSEIISISTEKELEEWLNENGHIIQSLCLLKAKKYLHEGKTPQQRFEEKIKSLKTQFKEKENA